MAAGAGLAIFSGLTGLFSGGLKGRNERQLAEIEAQEAKTRQTTIIVASAIFALVVIVVSIAIIQKRK